jgi:hypothetical protein
MEKSSDLIGDLIRNLLACSVVPQPTTSLHVMSSSPVDRLYAFYMFFFLASRWGAEKYRRAFLIQ